MPRFPLVMLLAVQVAAALGCEEVVVPEPAAPTTPDSGPKSALGKAHQRGVDLSRRIGVYQDDLSQQADSIFEDPGNPRREPDWEFESEDDPGSSPEG